MFEGISHVHRRDIALSQIRPQTFNSHIGKTHDPRFPSITPLTATSSNGDLPALQQAGSPARRLTQAQEPWAVGRADDHLSPHLLLEALAKARVTPVEQKMSAIS